MGLQLRLLFGLYVRPRRALAAIMDEGSIIFGAIAVLLVAGLFEAGGWARYWGDVARAVAPAAHAARALCGVAGLAFAALMVPALRTVFGARPATSLAAADTTPGYRRHEVREWRKHAARRLGAV